ncbi:hypothetical protein AZ019_001701, partial [Klebsiella pneumoniae]
SPRCGCLKMNRCRRRITRP